MSALPAPPHGSDRAGAAEAATCCSSATSPSPATPRPRSACVTGRGTTASASSRCAGRDGHDRAAAADAARGARAAARARSSSASPTPAASSEAELDPAPRRSARGRASTSSAACTAAGRTRRSSRRRPTRLGRRLIDVRQPPADIPVGTGRKRTGKRLLTVGTDCALGKKYTALAIARALRQRGVAADFRATGQTGIMIAGSGMPMDAVVSDFVAGAAEILSPDAAPDHWDVIEGQGSLFHPAYAGVSLGLLHGSQPDVIVRLPRTGPRAPARLPGFPDPVARGCDRAAPADGRATNPTIRCAGVSFNTAALSPAEADALMTRASRELGLPVADPMRGGAAFERLVEACLA